MKLQYFLIAVLTVAAFSVCSESNAQFFRQRFRPAAQPAYKAYSHAPMHSQPATFTQTPTQISVPVIHNGTRVTQSELTTGTTVRNATIQNENYAKNSQNYETDMRHVYRPIKGGMTKQGADGQTLILAKYIGTHRKDSNETRTGSFQDMQHGSMKQNIVKTNLAGKTLQIVPFLDGTLRWVPLVYNK